MNKAARILLPEAETRRQAPRRPSYVPGQKREIAPSPWADRDMYSISDFYVSFRTELSRVSLRVRNLVCWGYRLVEHGTRFLAALGMTFTYPCQLSQGR